MAEAEVQISTLVFLDFEATGLNNGKTKITELTLLSVQREELVTPYGRPRVVNKLTLCVNPMKPISMRASEITGLYNENLESQSPFDGQVIDMMVSYLTRLPQPVCLIAHYGNGFDFRLLASELAKQDKSLPGHIYCADSLEGFRELDGLSRTYVTPAKSPPNVTATMSTTSETQVKSPQIETTAKSTQNETPTKSTACSILPSDVDASSSTSSEGFNYSTPVGQHIPTDLECPGIKERARLAKRKSDGDLDTIPLKAKACRKRLFEAGGDGDDHDAKPLESGNNDDKLNVAPVEGERSKMDQKQSVSDAVSSKSDTVNVASDTVGVKKKLDFEPSNAAASKSTGVDNSEKCKVDSSEQASESCNYLSQSSIPDDILIDAVQGLEENVPLPEKESKKCSSVNDDVNKTKDKDKSNTVTAEKETRCAWYNQVVVQSVNTGMSYTLSKAERREKVMSYVTQSADHGLGPISSYEMNHKHFRIDEKGNVTVVTPKKETDSVEQKLYFSSENVNKKEMNKTLDNTGKDVRSAWETTPTKSENSGNTTPVKSYQNMNTTVDTPVSHLPPRLSYKLTEIYKRTFGHLPQVSHAAENDCLALMKVIKERCPEFLHWIDKNAVLFSTIEPL